MGSYFSSVPKTETNIPGHVAIVTGASRGLGFETSKQFYKLGATVYLGCRTKEGANKAIERILAEVLVSEGQLKWLPMDLSTIKQSRESAEEFLRHETRLDILVNNAYRGITEFEINQDGFDFQFAVNHIGHFVFTTTVLDLMKQTSAQPGSDVRIAIVTSLAHDLTYKTPISFLEPSDLSKPYPAEGSRETYTSQMACYGRSKVANILFASELQRRLETENSPIIVTSLHPGLVDTDGAHVAVSKIPVLGRLSSLIIKLFFNKLADGAGNSVFAAANPAVRANPEMYKGKYLAPVGKVIAPSALAQSVELSKQLWNLTEQIVESRTNS